MSNPAEEVTQQTLAQFSKSTAGIFGTSGMQGVDLRGRVSLTPANVPARNNTSAFPRVIAGEGDTIARWRAWLNLNSSQTDAAVGVDYAGSMTLFQEQDVFAPYKPLAKAGRVTLDAVAVARNYADALADAELLTLVQLFIAQDTHIINSQNWALGTATTPTVTTSTTGGSIAATTAVHVSVAARSGANYFLGGNSIGSADATVTTGAGSTNSVTATIPAMKGAVAYDWYVGTSASAGSKFYYTTTTVASCTFTSVPGAAQSLPTNLALLSSVAPSNTTPTADTSNSANWYNGIIASTLGDYGTTGPVAPGSGTATGASFFDNGGNAPALSGGGVDVLDTLNAKVWASMQLSPTAYMMNSAQGDEISKLIMGSNSATTFLPPTDADARTNLAGGGFVGRYVNRAAGGVPVAIEIHPRVAPGTIIARCDRVPFPASNIGSAFEVRCQYDTMRFDYAANYTANTAGGGPRYDFEIRSMETLVNFAPSAQAIATNIA